MSWFTFRSEPIIDTVHEIIINGTHIECNYLYCNYQENFTTVEDAEIAAEVHQTAYL